MQYKDGRERMNLILGKKPRTNYLINQLVLQVADNLENDIKRASLAVSTLYNDVIINDLVNKWVYAQDMNHRKKYFN